MRTKKTTVPAKFVINQLNRFFELDINDADYDKLNDILTLTANLTDKVTKMQENFKAERIAALKAELKALEGK